MNRWGAHGPVIGVASSIVSLILFATLLAPGTAVAGAFKCDSHWLYEDDEDQLRATAEAALPKSARLETVAPCRYLNSAHAWISTRKATSAEGVQQWWEITCWRRALRWQCDPPEFNQLILLSLAVEGGDRQTALSFNKDTTLDRARVLATRAIDIYVDPTSRLPECASGKLNDSKLVDLRRDNLPPTDKGPIQASVSRDARGESVWLHDVDVEIAFPAGGTGASDRAPSCWNVVIVVG